ncbi:MAG TPA: sigma 54-interacting transcriptional regulator [Polyangia bacterium]|jgi:transcriptional regulator with PAS, ATPase and Fis domain|nr:sigma 54-interacting transcriptional regulator [Polyangia bacterium]
MGVRVVGRDETCDSVLDGTEISRRHAEIRVDGPMLAVRDLNSRNGVFVDGIRTSDAPLALGAVVRCGEWIGIAVADEDKAGLTEIVSGWRGGPTLLSAIAPLRAAVGDLAVVLQGETGTGKEGLARAVHQWSGRTGPFVAINCAALPAHLAEAELFGYRRGAFTGADRASPGLFRAAHGGTLFLDEVLELPGDVQPKLLRVLQQREVQALGETTPVAVDVRIVAAAQEPLSNAVAAGRFRADLRARLDGLTIVLPPLRERRDEITPLFQQFLREQAGGRTPELDAKLVEALCLHDWPLNVRELQTLARKLLVLHGHEGILKRSHLPEGFGPAARDSPQAIPTAPSDRIAGDEGRARRSVDDAWEFAALVEALRANDRSVAKAARAIGVSRGRAYRLLLAHPEFSLEDLASQS